jgi:hypothetical protein
MSWFEEIDRANREAEQRRINYNEMKQRQILEKLPEVQLERLGSQEELAQRQQLARDLAVQQQAAQRQLAAQQAKMGVRGGAATAQQARAAQQLEQARGVQEEQGLLQRRLYNMEQAQKEKFANLSQNLALRQIAASLEGQRLMSEAAKEAASKQAQVAQSGGGGCCIILAVVKTGLLGAVSPVEAHQIIERSKTNLSELKTEYKDFPVVLVSLDQLTEAREIRDHLISKKQLRGYYKLSEKIAPHLEKYPRLTNFIARPFIINPILGIKQGKVLSKIYLKLWNSLGSDQLFRRKNGEIV